MQRIPQLTKEAYEKSIKFRLPGDDYNWLAQNAKPEISTLLRHLIRQARLKDEKRPLKVRIAETKKRLDDEKELFIKLGNIPSADSVEMTGILNRSRKTIIILETKLATLEGKTK
jgi:hypothetical protein